MRCSYLRVGGAGCRGHACAAVPGRVVWLWCGGQAWPGGKGYSWPATADGFPRWKDFSMSQVKESIEVDVPVTTAYNQWTQFESFPQFMDGVERIEQRTDTLSHWVTKVAGGSGSSTRRLRSRSPTRRSRG